MRIYLSHRAGDDHAKTLVELLTSSLFAHGVNVAKMPTNLLGRFIVWARQIYVGDLAVRIGFGWSEVARNHGTIAIYQEGDELSTAVAHGLAERTAETLRTQLRGFKRCGYKSDRNELFGDLRKQHRPNIKHNVLLMVCYSSNESNMKSYDENQSRLVIGLTNVIKYWMQ
jgi:hypothetical protein